MNYVLEELSLILVVGTPLVSSVAVLGFLIACVYDRTALWRGRIFGRELSDQDLSEYWEHLKKNRKRLLAASILCACSWVLVIVFFSMAIANM